MGSLRLTNRLERLERAAPAGRDVPKGMAAFYALLPSIEDSYYPPNPSGMNKGAADGQSQKQA